jgi:hypothetical protein
MQAVKFIIMQLAPRSVFLPYRSKYLPLHSVLKNPQSTKVYPKVSGLAAWSELYKW